MRWYRVLHVRFDSIYKGTEIGPLPRKHRENRDRATFGTRSKSKSKLWLCWSLCVCLDTGMTYVWWGRWRATRTLAPPHTRMRNLPRQQRHEKLPQFPSGTRVPVEHQLPENNARSLFQLLSFAYYTAKFALVTISCHPTPILYAHNHLSIISQFPQRILVQFNQTECERMRAFRAIYYFFSRQVGGLVAEQICVESIDL
ncbi:hypothetical protein F5883DRAFT_186267 [Diaporthe sp. PMI_573]|nr:hypothetical protein F5883DRAFT_186267 [Diaporthaceae sp. PMI_573]